MGLSALRTYITLLAITQVCEEMSLKIQKSISDHIGKGFTIFSIEKMQETPIFQKADNPKRVSSHFDNRSKRTCFMVW